MGNIVSPCVYCSKRGNVKVSITGHEVYQPGTNYWFFYDKQMAVLKDTVGEKSSTEIGHFTAHQARVVMHLIMCRSCYDTKKYSFPKDHAVMYQWCFRVKNA